jgi:hypothetical protein
MLASAIISTAVQGCQMVYFHTKNPNLGVLKRALELKMLLHFMVILNFLRQSVMFYGHLVYFVVIGIYSPDWVCFAKKNLATLCQSQI